jgi:hypothetical protein
MIASCVGVADLDQAELGPVGRLAHELGVHGDERSPQRHYRNAASSAVVVIGVIGC